MLVEKELTKDKIMQRISAFQIEQEKKLKGKPRVSSMTFWKGFQNDEDNSNQKVNPMFQEYIQTEFKPYTFPEKFSKPLLVMESSRL